MVIQRGEMVNITPEVVVDPTKVEAVMQFAVHSINVIFIIVPSYHAGNKKIGHFIEADI